MCGLRWYDIDSMARQQYHLTHPTGIGSQGYLTLMILVIVIDSQMN